MFCFIPPVLGLNVLDECTTSSSSNAETEHVLIS